VASVERGCLLVLPVESFDFGRTRLHIIQLLSSCDYYGNISNRTFVLFIKTKTFKKGAVLVESTYSPGTTKAQELITRVKPSYPLDIVWLLDKLNEFKMNKQVQLVPCDYLPDSVSASLIQHPGLNYQYIIYNSAHNIERKRFSVAHEFGHLALEHKAYSIGDDEDPAIKKEADDFATELLMPRSKFTYAAAVNFHLDPISLAMKLRDRRHFWTSLEATCRRLLDLGLFTGAFVLYDSNRRYFLYNSEDFDPCEDRAEIINKLLNEFKHTANPKKFSTKTSDLFFFARKFSSGQILVALTPKDCIGSSLYFKIAEQSAFWPVAGEVCIDGHNL